ncbi:Putative PAN/Apple domain, PA14/GLEYA domain-containing protein [Septoria linicola]|uniref:PAN/Apple domain, PA14/GLEYA domain-containing protein n=1 Tax=Septoria linicola TaxID=215465 RepID=A0A9Q9EQJ2_9PEZI|nr:Putative PAN/Apple domain, PA14/GLEYA domain-containing protein [Septoria linicola]
MLIIHSLAALVPWVLVTSVLASPTEPSLSRAATSCNVKGTNKNTKSYRNFVETSQDACGQKCKTDYGCSMYAYGEGKCYLYNNGATVAKNCRKTSYANRSFSDKSCAKDPVCGGRGYDKQYPRPFKTVKLNGIGSWAKCSSRCKADSRCASMAIRKGECALYDKPASNNFRADNGSPQQFFDASCAQPSTPTTTTSAPATDATAIMLPRQDSSVNRNDLRNILPTSAVTLVYAQKSPGTYVMKIAASMKSTRPAVLLENVAKVKQITCSNDGMVVELADQATAAAALLKWSEGTVLITLANGCNPDNERGVYITSGKPSSAGGTKVKVASRKATLQDVISHMEISYGKVVSAGYGQSSTTCTRTATSYYTGQDGGRTSTTFITTVTTTSPGATTTAISTTPASSSTTTSSPSASTTSASSTMTTSSASATTSSASTTTTAESTTTSSVSTTTSSSITTTTSVSTTTSSASTTSTTASLIDGLPPLSPSALAVLNEITEGLPPPDADGTINVPIQREPILPAVFIVEPPTLNNDPAYQAELQNAMTEDGLDTQDQVVDQAVEGLAGDEESSVPEDSPVQLSTEENEGRGDAYYDGLQDAVLEVTPTKRDATPARTLPAPGPQFIGRHLAAMDMSGAHMHQMSERDGDGWDTFFDVMGDDFVGEICKACELIAAGKALYDIGKCVFGGSCGSPPQVTITSLIGTGSQKMSYRTKFGPGAMYRDSKATIGVDKVGIDISDLTIEAKVKVTPKQANFKEDFVVSADVTVIQSAVTSALWDVQLKDTTSGGFDKALASVPAQSFSVPNVFTLSAKFIWGFGMTWDTTIPVDTKAGAIMTTNGARADFNVKARTSSNAANWEPSAQITYPKFSKPGRAVISPYTKLDVKISLMIFGTFLEDAVVIANQVNMAFDGQVLSQTESGLSTRSISTDSAAPVEDGYDLEKRGLFSIIARILAQIAANRAGQSSPAPLKTCDAGSMKLNTIMKTRTTSKISKTSQDLFTNDYRFGAKCIPFGGTTNPTTPSTGGGGSTPPSTGGGGSTPPSTGGVDATAPEQCGNNGLQFGIFTNQLNPNLDYGAMKSQQPQGAGSITNMGGFEQGTGFFGRLRYKVYGNTVQANYFSVVHKFYVYARKTGEYTFDFGAPDDVVKLWIGDKAIRGWDDSNSDLVAAFTDSQKQVFRKTLEKGKYYPVRFVFGQNTGPAYINEGGITDPDGNVLLSTSSGPSPWLMQFPCDRSSVFPDWSQES